MKNKIVIAQGANKKPYLYLPIILAAFALPIITHGLARMIGLETSAYFVIAVVDIFVITALPRLVAPQSFSLLLKAGEDKAIISGKFSNQAVTLGNKRYVDSVEGSPGCLIFTSEDHSDSLELTDNNFKSESLVKIEKIVSNVLSKSNEDLIAFCENTIEGIKVYNNKKRIVIKLNESPSHNISLVVSMLLVVGVNYYIRVYFG